MKKKKNKIPLDFMLGLFFGWIGDDFLKAASTTEQYQELQRLKKQLRNSIIRVLEKGVKP